MLRQGKQERYLKEVLGAIIKRYTTQVTWHSIARDLSIDHHKTVTDYIELLASMDVLYIQRALIEDKLLGAPKKARKILFCDPFVFHAAKAWVTSETSIYERHILPLFQQPDQVAALVEACVTTHMRRYYPTYSIKAEGEVDIAYADNHKCFGCRFTTRVILR